MADVMKNLWDIHDFLDQQLDWMQKNTFGYLKQQDTPTSKDPESFCS